MKRGSLKRAVAFLLSISVILLHASASADPIYKWTDEAGNTYYSTTPDDPGAKKSELPKLARENIDSKIRELKAETPPSCDKHGGVDCSRNADTDGSVICLDGYREAKLPFRFECMEAKLKSELLVKFGEKDEIIKHSSEMRNKIADQSISELFLSVRNMSGIKASGIRAELRIPSRPPIPIEGPQEIDAFGQADYILPAVNFSGVPLWQIERARYRIWCENCGTVLGRN